MSHFQRADDHPGSPGRSTAFKHERPPVQSRPSSLPYGGLRAVSAVLLCLLLAGCGGIGGGGGPSLGSIGHVRGFIGGVAVDGPRASLVARNILSSGGTAADAAVAAAFMLTVTYPVAASLAGGGQCLVFDGPRNKVEYHDFPVRRAAAGGTVPVPGLVRGLALLHAAHGRLAWAQLVSPAEQVARFGERVTRAHARVIQTPGILSHVGRQAQTALTQGADGRLLVEGSPHVQPELAASLSRIRMAGAGDFYGGLLGRSFVADAEQVGGRLTLEELRGYAIRTGEPPSRPFDAVSVYFGGDATPAMLAIWDEVVSRRVAVLSDTADLQALPAAVLQALSRPAQAGLAQGSQAPGTAAEGAAAGLGSVSIAVADRAGQAVACSISLGAPFGSGLFAANTGMLMAVLPDPRHLPQSALAVLGSPSSWRSRGSFAATSGNLSGAAPAALFETMLPMLASGANAETAQGNRRFAPVPGGAAIAVEPGMLEGSAAAALRQGLEAVGRPLVPQAGIGRVNLAYCPEGIPASSPAGCSFAHDPRGYGLGVGFSF